MVQSATFDRNGVSIDNTELKGKSVSVDCSEFIQEKGENSDLVPYWSLANINEETIKIERIVPMYPMSKDQVKYNRLIKVLSLYRLTLGQPRQEELLNSLGSNFDNEDNIDDLFINLSPFKHSNENNKSFV